MTFHLDIWHADSSWPYLRRSRSNHKVTG